MSKPHQSSSSFQQELELEIIKNIKDEYKLNVVSEHYTVLNEKTKVQIDLYDAEKGIIGEVFVTLLPFKVGQKRKFQSDLLKLITIEKVVDIKINHKLLILTVDADFLKNNDFKSYRVNEAIEHSEKTEHFLGKNSWLNMAIKEFGITVLYYVLDARKADKLKKVRIGQAEGMKMGKKLIEM